MTTDAQLSPHLRPPTPAVPVGRSGSGVRHPSLARFVALAYSSDLRLACSLIYVSDFRSPAHCFSQTPVPIALCLWLPSLCPPCAPSARRVLTSKPLSSCTGPGALRLQPIPLPGVGRPGCVRLSVLSPSPIWVGGAWGCASLYFWVPQPSYPPASPGTVPPPPLWDSQVQAHRSDVPTRTPETAGPARCQQELVPSYFLGFGGSSWGRGLLLGSGAPPHHVAMHDGWDFCLRLMSSCRCQPLSTRAETPGPHSSPPWMGVTPWPAQTRSHRFRVSPLLTCRPPGLWCRARGVTVTCTHYPAPPRRKPL